MHFLRLMLCVLAVSVFSNSLAAMDYNPVLDNGHVQYRWSENPGWLEDSFTNGKPDPVIWQVMESNELLSRPIWQRHGTIDFAGRLGPDNSAKVVIELISYNHEDKPLKKRLRLVLTPELCQATELSADQFRLKISFSRHTHVVTAWLNQHTVYNGVLPTCSALRLKCRLVGPSEPDITTHFQSLTSDISWKTKGGPGSVHHTIEERRSDVETYFLLNLDKGMKKEWFIRYETIAGAQVLLDRVTGFTEDGQPRGWRLEPPVTLWKWPVRTGDTWVESPELIVDNSVSYPTTFHGEVLSTSGHVSVPAGLFTNTLKLKLSYDSHLGRDVCIIHLVDDIGMIYERQTINDGRIRLTEIIHGDHFIRAPSLILHTDNYNVRQDEILNLYLPGVHKIDPVLLPLIIWCETDGKRFFISADGDFHREPVPFMIDPDSSQSSPVLTLQMKNNEIESNCVTFQAALIGAPEDSRYVISQPLTVYFYPEMTGKTSNPVILSESNSAQ